MEGSETARRSWPGDRSDLQPLLPLVLSVWMDGVLSPDELRALEEHVDRRGWLDTDDRRKLAAWLDPDAPPTPSELQGLGARIQDSGLGSDPTATASLTDLGLALWKADGAGDGRWADPTSVQALRALEASLGVLGAEAARRMAGVPAPAPAPTRSPDGVDPAALARFLEGDHREVRDAIRALLLEPEMRIDPGLPSDAYRERVFAAVRHLADGGWGRLGYPAAYGGSDDPGGAIAVFETLALGDLSVVVKFGVQFGLFGGSVLQLGTQRHHAAYLEPIGTLEMPGCYAMTETGHGSNVRDLETTATYDADADELVVHSPTEESGKDYIGNALHGRIATVFARLLVAGEDHGVHAVLVPIRGETGEPLPGVRIEDRGLKLGLNGVDNGRIRFERVRVPRGNLLDRFGAVDDAGHYRSSIQSSGRRFFTMLRTLVVGRVSIAAASVAGAKVGLAIAVRYTDGRPQFGANGAPERPVLDYPLLQRALMPRLATTFGLHFAVRALEASYAASGGSDDAELEVAAAGLKAYASDHCVDTLQACREACGGQGYMAENRVAALKADTDIFTTFEGANGVLYQLVAKGLLSRFRDQMGDLNLWRALQYLGERAETRLTELNPVATRRTDRDHLVDPSFHLSALGYREERLLRSAAQRIRSRLQAGIDSFDAVTEVQDHLVALARAHVERRVLVAFQDAVAAAPSPGLSETLRTLAALFALARIEADRGWFLEAGYLEPIKSRGVRSLVGELCAEVRESAPSLVGGFAIPEPLLPPLVRRSDTTK